MTTTHLQRIVTSVLLLPILAWAIFCGHPVLSLALTVVAGVGLLEFFNMFWIGREKLTWKILGLVAGTAIIWAPLSWSGTALVCLAGLLMVITFVLSYDQDKTPQAFLDSQVLFFGLIYLPFILRLMRHLTAMEIILVLLATFATDTGAFYAGNHFGGPKIWPSLSPKKTWAGSIGGLVACALVTIIFGLIFGQASWISFLLLALALNISAQLGDFFESALKRWRQVKDSGYILPGHGGILDRIDSLLFSLPLYSGLAALVPYF